MLDGCLDVLVWILGMKNIVLIVVEIVDIVGFVEGVLEG